MKYKKGDKVRVKKDLIEGQLHGGAVFYAEMSPLLGAIVTISHVFSGVRRYHLSENPTGEYWTDEMLEDVEEDKIEAVKFEAGKWYKGEANDYYFKAAGGLRDDGFGGKEVPVKEMIANGKHKVVSYGWTNPDFIKFALKNPVDLSEIQQYLPEGHPDKINTLEQSRESLLEEAKRRYPVGTRYIPTQRSDRYTDTSSGEFFWSSNRIEDYKLHTGIYEKGKWAEIVESPTIQQKITPNDLTPTWGWYPVDTYDRIYTVGIDPVDDESSKDKGESISHWAPCSTCEGTGTVMVPKLYPSGHTEVYEDCPDCGGLGELESDYDEEPVSEYSGRFSFMELISNKPPFNFQESPTNESDFPIISKSRIVNFSKHLY